MWICIFIVMTATCLSQVRTVSTEEYEGLTASPDRAPIQRYCTNFVAIVHDTTLLVPQNARLMMLAAISHNPLHVLSYHTNFRNTSLTTTEVDPSILTTGQRTSFSGATGVIGWDDLVDHSKEAMFSEHTIGPIDALSSAHSIVVPTLSSRMRPSSSSITATSRLGLTSLVISSKWDNSSDVAVPTITNAEPYQWASTNTSPTHCVSGKYYGALSDLCSSFNPGHGDTTARDNATSSLNSVPGAANLTTRSSCTEVQGLPTSSVVSPGDDTEQPLAQGTESRGWGDFPMTTTELQSRTITDQSSEKPQYAEINGSRIRTYDATPSVTHLTSASIMSQMSTCTSEIQSQMNISNADTPSEAATNDTLAAPSTTSSPLPTLASTAHLATTRRIWVLVCLGAMVIFHI